MIIIKNLQNVFEPVRGHAEIKDQSWLRGK